MAKRSTPSDRVIIDPNFVIPEGAEDQFVYSKEPQDVDVDAFGDQIIESESFEAESFDELDYDDGADFEESYDVLETPEDFIILAQTLRRAPGGQQVIDIVIETEDIDGATNYEIQVTKT